MAAQAAMIADTISGMKKALSGLQYLSGSDESIQKPTNRGNKLKRKAQYVREGQLDLPNGPKTYKRKIEHAGYQRSIISHNPKRYDEYGDELDYDDVDEEADAAAAEDNPYSDIKLEHLLGPLTSAAILPNHPSLATPYASNVLSGMVQQACDMVHKERKTLWDTKHILTKFRGDSLWIPCESIQSDCDTILFTPNPVQSCYHESSPSKQRLTYEQRHSLRGPLTHAQVDHTAITNQVSKDEDNRTSGGRYPGSNLEVEEHNERPNSQHEPDRKRHTPEIINQAISETVSQGDDRVNPIRVDVEVSRTNGTELEGKTDVLSGISDNGVSTLNVNAAEISAIQSEEDPVIHDTTKVSDVHQKTPSCSAAPVIGLSTEDAEQEAQVKPRRMTTRAQAQAASEKTASSQTRSPSLSSFEPPIIHPFFLVPQSALPDRDYGLPPAEAEDTRRMLMLWVQKQEEVCRGADTLYKGLLKADRMRKTVFKWCKAEGHVGEMSDGEDWYDKDEWGLDEDLKKGHDEDEDDTATQGKKTRGRRT